MRAQTIMLTVTCEYCGTPKTYKSLEAKHKGNANGHIHTVCKKARKENRSHGRNDLM